MSLWNRLRNTFRSSDLDVELKLEMETHLAELQYEAKQVGRGTQEAQRAASLQFGNVASYREQTRERNVVTWLETLLQDLRYASRQLKQSPGFSVPMVLLLALGIGVNIAMFTLLNTIVLASLPLPDPNRLVLFMDRHADGGSSPPSWLDQRDFREQNHVFESMGAFAFRNSLLCQIEQQPFRTGGGLVTPDYFKTLGVLPIAGRLFSSEEGQPGRDNVAVLREDFWHSQFASDPSILGRTISVNGLKRTIVGILPRSATFPSADSLLWIPLVPTAAQRADRSWHGFPLVGRLRPGLTLVQARSDLDAIMLRMSREYPEDEGDRTAVVIYPLREWTVGQTRDRLLLLQYAATAIFLMACANVSSLVLARQSRRRREFAMRAALGASRLRLIRQRLTEAFAISITGGLCSAMVAWILVRVLIKFYGSSLPRAEEIGVDYRLVCFAFGVILMATLLLGFTTSIQGDAVHLESTLREGKDALGNRFSTQIRKLLIAVQVACALTLVGASFQLLQSFQNLMSVNSGINASHLLTFHVALPEQQYQTAVRANQFFANLTDRVSELPGVQSAATINLLPVQSTGYNGDVEVAGLPPHPTGFFAEYRWVTGDYFRTMGIPIIGGRDFTGQEIRGAGHPVIVNQAMAHALWGTRNPIGWTLQLKESAALDGLAYTVIGIAHDVHQSGLEIPARPEMEFPLATMPEAMTEQVMVVRTAIDESSVLTSIRQETQRLNSSAAISNMQSMSEVLGGSFAVQYARVLSSLLSGFGLIALFIAAFGLYGVTSYLVAERLRELAIRLAVGASRIQIMNAILRQGASMLILGSLVGIVGVISTTRLFESALFGVQGIPLAALVTAFFALTAAALLGMALPVLRATRVDPVQILRQE
jgi:putative ABC transport system permease protein